LQKLPRSFFSTVQFKTRILYDGLYTFAIQAMNFALAFALGLLTARLLGPTGKGIYAFPVIQAGLVGAVFGGLSTATSYYLLNKNAGRQIVRPLSIATAVFVAAGSLVVLIVAALGHALWAAPAAIASLPATAAIAAFSGYVTGIKRIRYVSSLSMALALTTLLLTSGGLFLLQRSPFVAIAAWVLSTTAVGATAWIAMLVHAKTLNGGQPVDLGRYATLALKGGAGALVSLLNYRADLYIVAIMLPTRDLGLYSVATSAPMALLFPAQVVGTVMSPHIGGLDRRAAAGLAARCARHNMLISIAICGAVSVFAPTTIQAFYGAAFVPLVPALRILLVGVVALTLASPIASFYTLKLAKPEISLSLAGISAAICTAGTIALIPPLGIVGAACASTAGYIVAVVLGLFYFRLTTGVGFASMLLPTTLDLRLYIEFLRRLWQDASRLLRRSARTTG
jgi:O-antigen/teichoic acid export membrane protein